jgi:hypothetical protein
MTSTEGGHVLRVEEQGLVNVARNICIVGRVKHVHHARITRSIKVFVGLKKCWSL